MRTRTALFYAAALTLTLSACSDPEPPEEGPGVVAGDGLEVVGTDQLRFEPEELATEAGEISVELTSEPAVVHNFVIDETDELVVEAPAGQSATGTVTLEEGSYTFYCAIPGHRQAGMVGTLTVSG